MRNPGTKKALLFYSAMLPVLRRLLLPPRAEVFPNDSEEIFRNREELS
jgi:hypothetical protein